MVNFSPMKRLLQIAALTAALAIVPACNMHEQEAPEKGAAVEKLIPVHFHTDTLSTKTAFGEAIVDGNSTSYQAIWSGNEDGIAVSLNLNAARKATVTPSTDGLTATFDASFPQSEIQAPYVFYALSPFSASISATETHGGYHLSIPADQRALANSCDEAAMVLVGSKEAQSIDEFGNVEIPFSHLTAYGRMSLTKMPSAAFGTILSIELTASEPFAGQFYYNFATGELTEAAASRTVTIVPANDTPAADNGSTFKMEDIWFACAPADLGGNTLKVVVNTSLGRLTRTVNVPQSGLAFNAGRVSKFAVNMSSAVFEPSVDRWVLVEDASSLKAGDEIILASSKTVGAAYAMSTTQNNNNRGVTSISIATDQDSKIILQNPGSSVEVLKLVSGAYIGYFYLQEATSTTGRYLYTTSSTSKNYLYSGTVSTATSNSNKGWANWMFTAANGMMSITAYSTVNSGGINYKHIRYNGSGNNRLISAYKNTSRNPYTATNSDSPVFVFRKEAGVNGNDDPILQNSEYGAYLSSGNFVMQNGRQLSREYMSDGTVSFAIMEPAAGKIVEFNGIPQNPAKGDSFTLNYNVITGRSHTDSDFEVSVVKVDGPKVWLSDGSGNGFIVKK